MSSLTAFFLLFLFLLTVVVNYEPPRSQQVLPAGHPCESHKGPIALSKGYDWRSSGFSDSQKNCCPRMEMDEYQGRVRRGSSRWHYQKRFWNTLLQRSRCAFACWFYHMSQTDLTHKSFPSYLDLNSCNYRMRVHNQTGILELFRRP